MKKKYSNNQNRTLRSEELAKAMEYKIKNSEKGYKVDDSVDFKKTADTVLGFFGINDRIIDNILERKERSIFYMLEDVDLLRTDSEEVKLYDGKTWRISYWEINRDSIYGVLDKIDSEKEKEEESIYEDLDEGIFNAYMEEV